MSSEKFKKYYQNKEVTKGYDLQREGTDYRKKKREKELCLFLRLLDKRKGEKVLEVGCSSGFLTKHLGIVTAIDTSKNMLRFTKKKNPKAKVLEADMFNLPFRANSFNKIVTMRVWNHLDEGDLDKVLKESKRVLKKGGKIVFDFEEKSVLRRIASFFYKFIFKTKGFKVYQYSFGEIESLLNKNGFQLERSGHLNHRVGRQIIIRARKRN